MKLLPRLKTLAASPWGQILTILLLGLLAYGLYIPWMGFYWDDWPWIWFSKVMGTGGMLKIDVEHRPVSGLILYLGALISGDHPIGWQIINWTFRLLGTISLAWMLDNLWPDKKKAVQWVPLLFLVYPGFSQQFVAVNTSRHLFPLATFFLSLGLMIKALRNRTRYWVYTGLSLIFSLVTMFTTEYYYGIELIRPVLIWLVLSQEGTGRQERVWRTLKSWLPYLLPVILIFIWRYVLSKDVNYHVTIFDTLTGKTGQGLVGFISAAFQDVVTGGFSVWGNIFTFPDPGLYGVRTRLYYWGLVCTASILTLLALRFSRSGHREGKWWPEAVSVGGVMLILSLIPFWAAGLDLKTGFPFDRLTLPMMVGSSLVVAGLLDASARTKPANWIIIPAIIGLSVGFHYQNGLNYRRNWQYQSQFFQELAWRIPSMKPGTAILTNELKWIYSTDNSLTAPLNWQYAPNFSEGDLPLYLYYVDLRFEPRPEDLSPKSLSNKYYRFYPFRGSPDQVLVLYNQPPSCPRILSYDLHKNFPGLPPKIMAALPYSNLDLVQAKAAAALPPPLLSSVSENGWCEAFEKADLARQSGNWETTAAYADQALALGHSDSSIKHVTEYEVFIEGYGHTGQWGKARQLSYDALELNPEMAPMLCDVWDRIQAHPDFPPDRAGTVSEVKVKLDCGSYLEP